MFTLWLSPYDDFLYHWSYSLSKAVFHHFSKWFPIHKNIKLNFLLTSARPWPRPDLTQLSPGSHLVPSAITISLSHSALSQTDTSLALFRKNPTSELVLEAVTSLSSLRVWGAAPVTLSALKCYMTSKPILVIGMAALTLKNFRTSQGKMFENQLKLWLYLPHFCFDRYFRNLPLRAHMAMPL